MPATSSALPTTSPPRAQIEEQASALIDRGAKLVSLGGDHTIAYPLLRAHHRRYGPVALVHFDAHLDTWDTYFDAPLTHGTPFRRAAEEVCSSPAQCAHRHSWGALLADDLDNDAEWGSPSCTFGLRVAHGRRRGRAVAVHDRRPSA